MFDANFTSISFKCNSFVLFTNILASVFDYILFYLYLYFRFAKHLTMDDDAEFRDIIVKSLENNGVLQKMRVSPKILHM